MNTWILQATICCSMSLANAQLQPLPSAATPCVFAGEARKISVLWQNAGNQMVNTEIHIRIFQTSSATAVLISEIDWKKLQVLPGQTVVESAQLDFPNVKTRTKFLVQWLENSNVLGATEVLIYPTNLFQTLLTFADETNFGVFDPGNELKPLLKAQGIRFEDLGQIALDNFSGQLAVIGPFQTKAQIPDGLANRIETIAKKNVAVVWIQPPQEEPDKLQPSFYCVQKSQTAVVVVQPDLVFDFAENPRSQLNLIYFCQLALNPQPRALPDLLTP